MFNFLKTILGIPPHDGSGLGIDDEHPSNTRNDFWNERSGNNERNDGNNLGMISEGNVNINVPSFNDPFEIHKFVEHLIDRMFESSEIFRMPLGSIFFSEEGTDEKYTQLTPEPKTSQSLRDSFLKVPDSNTAVVKKKDIDLDGKVTAEDVENYLQDRSRQTFQSFFTNFNFSTQNNGGDDDDNDENGDDDDHGYSNQQGSSQDVYSYNQKPNVKFYSKSVYVESIVKPDGSVKIIKKVKDSNGNEKTIIEDNHSSNYQNDQFMPVDDSSGISIFKKFFPF